jgi:hypothetical protein
MALFATQYGIVRDSVWHCTETKSQNHKQAGLSDFKGQRAEVEALFALSSLTAEEHAELTALTEAMETLHNSPSSRRLCVSIVEQWCCVVQGLAGNAVVS